MSRRWLGLLLFGIWLGRSGAAHATLFIVPPDNGIDFGHVVVGIATPASAGIALNADATTTVNPLTLGIGGGCGQFHLVTVPPLIVGPAPGPADVVVEFKPTSPGLHSCTVTAHPNTGPDLVIAVTGFGDQGTLTMEPTSLDLGAVPLGGTSMQMFTLRNTGNVVLDRFSFALDNTAIGYSFSPPASLTLGLNQGVQIAVLFAPTAVNHGGAARIGAAAKWDITTGVRTITNTTPAAVLALAGRGIDRKLFLEPVPEFPPTFRNPGDTAPIRPITVRNTGEATLRVSAVMISGEPVWQLVDASTGTVEIPGGGSHDFQVKFSPITDAAAPPGQLTIVNDDNSQPMKVVLLTGTAVPRPVAFGPQTIELGSTFVGARLTAQTISVTNMDPSASFSIHAIELSDDPEVFRIDNTPFDLALPAADTRTFSVTFTPTTLGHFETTARLLLDQDDVPQATIKISADASSSVAIHGGGGCATRGGGTGGAMLVVVIFALRRRRRMHAAAVSIAILTIAGSARAEDVVLGVFDPTPAIVTRGFQLESPEVGGAGSWVASGMASYATDVLVIDTNDTGGRVGADHAIKRRTMFSLGGAYAFLERFEAGIRLPMYMQHGDTIDEPRSDVAHVPPASGTALGDMTLHAKARLARFDAATLGAAVHVTLPTATAGQFTGVDLPTARVLALSTWSPARRFSLSGTVGFVLRKTSVYREATSISQGSGLAWGAGASYEVLPAVRLTAELFGELTRSGRDEPGMNSVALAPVEAIAGVAYQRQRIALGAALGRGVTDGIGAPGVRGVVTLAYTTGAPAATLHSRRPPASELDTDHDGLSDAVDRCPHEPENRDGYQDDDGCPEPDGDRDGIADAIDKCPGEPEDRDGFQDDDGCPDPDNDRDGIADAVDKCPNEPEVVNGLDDEDGCPDVVDAADRASVLKAAQAMFDKGLALFAAGNYPQACEAFEQSQRLDPQFGTQFNIAGCDEKIGKLASAWHLYRGLARSDSNVARRGRSNQLAIALAPRVPKIKLVLRRRPADLRVLLGDVDATTQISVETPMDRGSYTITATAAGYRAWSKTVEVNDDSKVITVVIDLQAGP